MLNRSQSSQPRMPLEFHPPAGPGGAPTYAELSSWMDGDTDGVPNPGFSPCAMWLGDAQLRDHWHAYHLIGDVLRSDDLAHSAAADAAFLQTLRLRLADEPALHAPASKSPAPWRPDAVPKRAGVAGSTASARFRRGWQRRVVPVAVAAGVMTVATVVIITQGRGGLGERSNQATTLAVASAPVPAQQGQQLQQPLVTADASGRVPPAMLRDSHIDRYMAAHRKLANDVVSADRPVSTMRIVHEAQQ